MRLFFIQWVMVFICLSQTAQAELYKWVDEEGTVHYSDQKLEDDNIEVEEFVGTPITITQSGVVSSEDSWFEGGSIPDKISRALSEAKNFISQLWKTHDTQVISNDNMNAILEQHEKNQIQEKLKQRNKVEIFTTPTCGYCKKAIRYLKENKIYYTERDVSKNRKFALRQKELGGGGGVPFAVINGKKIKGWGQAAYAKALY